MKEQSLPVLKQKLLNDLLWHCGNFIVEDPQAYLEFRFDELVHLICQTYRKSLSPKIWLTVVWVMKLMAKFVRDLRQENTRENTLMTQEHDYSVTDVFTNFCV